MSIKALRKHVKDVVDQMPEGGQLFPVHGAGVIGLQMRIDENKVLHPEVTFWSNLAPEYAMLMLKEILKKMEAETLNRTVN